MRHKGIWILAVALSLSLIATALSVILGGSASPLADFTQNLSRPFQTLSMAVDQNVSHFYGQAFRYDQILTENKRLREEVTALQEEVRNTAIATRENTLLRELLEFKKVRRDLQFEPVKVLSRSATNWNRSITISKGTDQGISPSDCVVDASGTLLGIVSEVGSNWSTVFLTTDAGFEMGGEDVSTGERGVLEGDFELMSSGQLKLSYLSRETQIAPGDEVISFATEGVYPAGLLVGTVTSLHTDPSGMYSYAVITPSAALDELSQVFVVTDFVIED
jgi:rod shape-determining protein MreC